MKESLKGRLGSKYEKLQLKAEIDFSFRRNDKEGNYKPL
jgi:hypothetical protein